VSFADSLKVALEALMANKLRAMLTMLGIIIGVGSVIALMAVGQGSQKAISDQILGLGSNLLFVRPGSSTGSGNVRMGAGSALTLSTDDAASIVNVNGVAGVASQLDGATQIIGGAGNTFTRYSGVEPSYFSLLNLPVAEGDYFTDDDVQRASRNVVLGSTIANTLFPNGNAVGSQLRLSQGPRNIITFNVVGVLQSKGGNASNSSDDRIFVPLTVVQRQIAAQRGARNAAVVSQITIQTVDGADMAQVKQDITNVVSTNHRVATPDFTVESQEDLANAASQSAQTLTVLLGAIAGISLVVGGIGIMNIMLVSVTERTREIGIRKAVGARSSDIMMQFLTEALTVTALGGLLGVVIGLGAAEMMNGRDLPGLGDNVQTAISWTAVGMAFVVATSVGLFFGIYPASRASKLKPIDALHYE
jgi:putative ABC transport system permease protein